MRYLALFTTLLLSLSVEATSRSSIADSAQQVNPLMNSMSIGDITLKDADGNSVSLNQMLKAKPAVVLFYRGGWCPYCNRQLADLTKVEQSILDLGYQIIAISPDSPARLQQQKFKTENQALLLSDDQLAATRAFGLAFYLDDAVAAKYRDKLGVTFVDLEGTHKVALPAPAAYILNQKGEVLFNYVNPDYSVRIPGDLLYHAAKVFK